MDRRLFTLLLAMTPGIGGKSLVRILARNDVKGRSPEEFLSLSEAAYREEYRLTAQAAARLASGRQTLIQLAAKEMERLERHGVTWMTVVDAAYPDRLEAFDPDPPGLIFTYGNSALLKAKTFCVLSSRNAPRIALDDIELLTERGVLSGEVLVTGHDKPEYQRAAVVPLRWGAPRILCLDRGLFNVLGSDLRNETSRASRLWRYEFDPRTDLVISPFLPDMPMMGTSNRRRDRLVAALSDRLEFVSVSRGGNMEALLVRACQLGKMVRFHPDDPHADLWREKGATSWSF